MKKRAFTLVELLVTISVLITILTIALVATFNSRRGAYDAQRLNDVKQMQLALEMHYRETGHYPDSLNFGQKLNSPLNENNVFMSNIPKNPRNSNPLCDENEYIYTSDGKNYFIEFCLDKKQNDINEGINCVTKNGIINSDCFFCDNRVVYQGEEYPIVKINKQCWLAKNLNIGVRINSSIEQSDNEIIEKYCYKDNENNCNVSGGLYQWNEAMNYSSEESSRGICPEGWHIPTHDDWTTLERSICLLEGNDKEICDARFPKNNFSQGPYFGVNEGFKLKASETGISSWIGSDDYGFTVLPSGFFNEQSQAFQGSDWAYFWTSSISGNGNPWRRLFSPDQGYIQRIINAPVDRAVSIRCVQD